MLADEIDILKNETKWIFQQKYNLDEMKIDVYFLNTAVKVLGMFLYIYQFIDYYSFKFFFVTFFEHQLYK